MCAIDRTGHTATEQPPDSALFDLPKLREREPAVIGMGKGRGRLTTSQREQCWSLFQQGWSLRAIARHLGCSWRTARKWAEVRRDPQQEAEQGFWSRVDKSGPTLRAALGPCWQWTGASRGGYGQVWIDGARYESHRISYANCVGPLVEGLEIDHLCHNPSCVRPDHLEQVTRSEHIRRTRYRDGHAVTHCPRGHSYAEQHSTYAGPNVYHRCRICRSDTERKSRRARNHSVREIVRFKLTQEQVAELRTRYARGGVTQSQLAQEYGLSRSVVQRLVARGVK